MPGTLKKASGQPLRVYRDNSDATGLVLCLPHRDRFYALNPAASGAGEYGGECEHCRAEGTACPAAGNPDHPRGTQQVTREQRVRNHLSAARDGEDGRDYGYARAHYQMALTLASAAERPAIQEALDRLPRGRR